MTHSETIAALAAALSAAQGQYPVIPRDRVVRIRTKAGGEYTFNYAPLDSILSALRPVLCANGLSVMQDIEDGAVSTMILHSSGEWWRGATVHVTPDEPGPKAVGSALTYAQRYSLRAALNVATDDDDDATTAAGDHMTVKAPQSPQDASTPRSDARHSEPANPVNAEGSDVNAGASQKHGSPCAVYGQVKGAIYPEEKRGKDGKAYHVASFDLLIPANANGGTVYHVTAWHDAADVAETLQNGEWVDITGTWNVWQGRVKINANSITFQQQTQQPAVDTTTDDEIPF
jgi:hypothetical protein